MIYQVFITATAQSQIRQAAQWWADRRPEVPSLFVDELASTLGLLRTVPLVGSRYSSIHSYDLRRILLKRSLYHVYYTVQPTQTRVIVRAVWHSARGRKPHLR